MTATTFNRPDHQLFWTFDHWPACPPSPKQKVMELIGTTTAQAILVGYAILLLGGGLFGFLKARSRPSLLAGTIGGALALVASGIMASDFRGIWLGIAPALMMTVVFAIRFRKTGKFMPSGMLGVVSLAVLAVLILATV